MTLIVEDGTGKPDAESYVSGATTLVYASARGLTFTNDAAGEQALRRATTWLDNTYRMRFPGMRRMLRAQALEWPRVGALDMNGFGVPYDAVPIEIINATIEAAVRELASAGSLAPDITTGKIKRRVRVEGAVEVEYAIGSGDVASQSPTISIIDGILAPLLGRRSQYTALAVRG